MFNDKNLLKSLIKHSYSKSVSTLLLSPMVAYKKTEIVEQESNELKLKNDWY